MSYLTATITAVREETRDVKTFTIDKTPDYKAGQFLTIVSSLGEAEERRSYSFSSAPKLNELPSFTVKRISNGWMSRKLIDHAKPGDTLLIAGVNGFFTIPDDLCNYSQIIFLAAGIGITPIFSLVKTLLLADPPIYVTLIYSNQNRKDAIFYDELQQLAETYPGVFSVEFLFSSSYNLNRARLNKWLLPKLMQEYMKVRREQILFYICGPFSYTRMVLLSLEEQKIPEKNIRRENFDNTIPLLRLKPPDKGAHNVTVKIKDIEYLFLSEYPNTILKAAKQKGIDLPYSCENGICGSCVMRCTMGKVWHSNNEVLTEKELSEGLILTCVGYPIDGDITLESL